GQEASQKAEEMDITQKRTGETKTIQDYEAEKFIFKDKDGDENKKFVVWMTQDIDVNWGMLAEPWGNNADKLISSSDFPVDLIFTDKYFPLRFESYENDELKTVLESTEVNKTDIDPARVEVPAGVTVLSMQNYLFQKMSEGQ